MKKPLSPPEQTRLAAHIGVERGVHLLLEVSPGLPDTYLHWDVLRHKQPPEGISVEEWWMLLKSRRAQNAIPVPFTDKEGRSFTYGMPDRVLAPLHEIDSAARGVVAMDELSANAESRDRYVVSSLIEEAITSSQLEGAATTRPVAVEMLRSGRQPRDKDERMILNNYLAMQHIRTIVDQPLSPGLVFELHRILTEGTLENANAAGRLQRPGEKRVSVWDDSDGTLLHQPPPAEALPARLEALCAFANGEADGGRFIHPIIRAIALHFWLAYDHPFEDGNGRTARALFYWAMLRYGYWLFEFVSISHLLRKAPKQYSRAYLYTETDGNDLTYFVLHQLDIMQRAIDALHAYLARKSRQLRDLERTLAPGSGYNHRQRALLAHALRHPGSTYTIQSHQTSHAVAYGTARSDLLDLAERHLLEIGKRGRAMVFRAPADLEERLKVE